MIFGLAVEVYEDEMFFLVELRRENSLLHKKHLHHFHIQSDLLLDLPPHRVNHALPNFDMSTWESVLVKPFVRSRKKDLALLVDNQGSHRWFRKHLFGRCGGG
ncbi:hypothetical protein AUF62_00590 [archaeon 13_1_20CM_52_20]|nr:MAG: hypothetical protein AUF62_00590 [archaeon 13_1_20CM_52_20]